MQKSENISIENLFCIRVLSIDPSIRFVGMLCKCGRLKAYRRKKDMVPQLNIPETKLVHREALLRTKMSYVFDEKLGKTNWSIESREHVKWINIPLNKDILLISTEISSDHDKIIKEILSIL